MAQLCGEVGHGGGMIRKLDRVSAFSKHSGPSLPLKDQPPGQILWVELGCAELGWDVLDLPLLGTRLSVSGGCV